ncbi:MAG: glycosyltransferase [Bryobacterales bacterium]|nr:glycosyltransferase [Bryobacterales bacterium]
MNAVKVLFASGSDAVNAQTLEKFKNIFPELPLVVVSEFAPGEGEWIRYHIRRRWSENRALIRSRLRGRKIRIAAIILEPRTPHREMRLLGLSLAPLRLLAFNEAGQHFRVSPGNALVMFRHLLWRARNFVRSRRAKRRLDWKADWIYWRARRARSGRLARPARTAAADDPPAGISVVIPSRNGRDLLAECLPRIDGADEIIIVDNGSDDETAGFLRDSFANAIIERSATPLSFAEAVNRGLTRARFSHVCLLNNDMLVEPGFLAALRRSFDCVPGLFSSTAQIFFPESQRREETGKTVLQPERAAAHFPVQCVEPVEGEDGTWVLYGSGGCTLYDAAKLRELGGFDEVYETAYVEDLDLGVRGWQRGWPSVYCAEARVLHKHRATTSRYFSREQLDGLLERNFLRFLARVLPHLWKDNLRRLRSQRNLELLNFAASLTKADGEKRSSAPLFLRALNGDVAVFPGRPRTGKPVVLIASPYLPFPLSHGGAVRMYNLMRRATASVDQVLICFVDEIGTAPRELTEICAEVIMVRRRGSHALPSTPRPDTVEEFDSPVFRQALLLTKAKWHPRIAQLEFTQMAQYAADCHPARTVLVEHDITYDLYAQMLAVEEDWENRRQYERWLQFERRAWRTVDRVVTMSETDSAKVRGSVVVPNGVDIERFRPSGVEPEPRRLLFIGSFAHRPNVLALEFFLRDVFPRLSGAVLHVIAGQRHTNFWDLHWPGVQVEGFVADVRPAYERAAVVIAPLIASAGTNIKIMEAMAMGKAIVSTTAGIHGLDDLRPGSLDELRRGCDVMVEDDAQRMAAAIAHLFDCSEARRRLEIEARRTAERHYNWDSIAKQQRQLYKELLGQA